MAVIRRIWDSLFEAGGRARVFRKSMFIVTLVVGATLYAIRALALRTFVDAADLLRTLDSTLRVIFVFFVIELGLAFVGWEIWRLASRHAGPSSSRRARFKR